MEQELPKTNSKIEGIMYRLHNKCAEMGVAIEGKRYIEVYRALSEAYALGGEHKEIEHAEKEAQARMEANAAANGQPVSA